MANQQRLRLPGFVTVDTLATLLNWPFSLRRQFLEAAKRRLVDWPATIDDALVGALELLSRPGGAQRVEELVAAIDPSKRRGLGAALQRSRLLGTGLRPPAGSVSEARQLCEQRSFEAAAWSAFVQLATDDPRLEPADADRAALIALIEKQPGLQQWLNPYWSDWQALATGTPAPADTAGDQDGAVDPAAAWTQEIATLRAVLEGVASFDPTLPERLRVVAATLHALHERAAGEADRMATEQRASACARAVSAIAALGDGVEVRALATLDLAAVPDATPAVLAELADWAATAQAALTAANERCAAATARREAEDSDAADEEFVAATKQRRAARSACAVEATEWLELMRGAAAAADIEPVKVAASEEAVEPATVRDSPERVEPPVQALPVEEPQARPEPLADAPLPAPPPAAAVVPATAEPQVEEICADVIDDGQEPAPSELDAFLPPPADDDGGDAATLAAATRRALAEGRHGLAAQLDDAVRALGASGIGDGMPVLRALAVGAALSSGRLGAAVTAYARLTPAIYAAAARGEAATPATRLLLVAGAIKPAIFFSQTGAAEVFRQAEPGGFGAALHEVCELLGEMPRRGGHLDFADLAPAADAHSRRRAADAIRAELLNWVDTAADRRAKFRRADDILIKVFATGAVGEAIAAMRRNAPGAADKALTGAAWLGDNLERRATQLDDEERRPRPGAPMRGAPMEGQVRTRLVAKLGEAAALLRRWAAADRAAQGGGAGHAGEVTAQLRHGIAAAIGEIERIDGNADTVLAATVAARVFAEVVRMLDGDEVGDARLDLNMVLDDELLLLHPYPALGPDGEWTEAAARDAAEGIAAVLDGPAGYDAAFNRLIVRGRFAEAAAAVDRIAAEGSDRRHYDDQLRDQRQRRRETLAGQAAALRRKLDDVLGADTVGSVDLTLQGEVEKLAVDLTQEPDAIEFPPLQARLRALEQQVDDLAELLLAPLLGELEALDLPAATAATLRRLADKRDLTTLREHVEAAKMGVDIGAPAGQRLRAFAARFLSPNFEKVAAADRNTASLIEAAKARRDTPAADFAQLQQEDVAGATELLEAWRDLKAPRIEPTRALVALFTALRFTSVKVTTGQPLPPARRFALACDRITDRALCPVPAFGSAARGGYAVLLIDTVAVSSGAELFKLVQRQESPTTRPTFILVVGGPLPASRRLEYMREARRRGALEPCALIDEATILSLASRPGRGLSDLFAVTLPTGAVQPYSDANGQTSPEMFFGRAAELTQLWDPNGSCLVYGGRQLGKTALLEQLRLRHHRPPTQIVVGGSIDGKTDIWPWLASELKKTGVIVKATHATAVCEAVETWLKGDTARRLLVLADEADILLESQMKGDYGQLKRVRTLMQETERRCKFVFAGLHNVQRLARQPNSPLLHFGTPLRVGPLYREDLGEARAMLEQPMAAAGFVFGADTLPGRVLSELGYYPSLLQTFGRTMIERLNRAANARMTAAAPLPIVIAEADVDEALNDPQFRSNVSGKFEATLSLDERYRLITYAMLVHAMDRQGQSPALSDVEVQERALYWWPQGFAEDRTLDAFQGLLQEMVGLGVLIETDGRYAIRSSRIGAMLGGPEEIDKKLLEMSEMPSPPELEMGNLRRLDGSHVPSPLTARQEGVMLAASDAPAVQLVLGSKALGLDELVASLEMLPDDQLVVEQASYANAAQLIARVDRVVEHRTLLVLTGPWPDATVVSEMLHAAPLRRSRRGARRSLQVLLAPVTVDWVELGAAGPDGRFAGVDLLTLAPLGNTGLRQWLRAVAGGDPAEAIAELKALTGGFPLFLKGLRGSTPAEVIEQARAAHGRLRENPATLTAIGLGDPPLKRAAELLAEFGYDSGLEDFLRDEGVVEPGAALLQLERLGILELPSRAGEEKSVNPLVASLIASV